MLAAGESACGSGSAGPTTRDGGATPRGSGATPRCRADTPRDSGGGRPKQGGKWSDQTRGDGDEASEATASDDDSLPAASLQSFAPSAASGCEGDIDFGAVAAADDVTVAPDKGGDQAEVPTVVGEPEALGEADAAVVDTSVAGTLGILCGNWGGHWAEIDLQEYMISDLKSGPCSFVLLQDAKRELTEHLMAPGAPGTRDNDAATTRGRGGHRLGRCAHPASTSCCVDKRRGPP